MAPKAESCYNLQSLASSPELRLPDSEDVSGGPLADRDDNGEQSATRPDD